MANCWPTTPPVCEATFAGHWCLDIIFADDQRRIRQGHTAENFARLSRIALNLLKAKNPTTAESRPSGSVAAGITTTY